MRRLIHYFSQLSQKGSEGVDNSIISIQPSEPLYIGSMVKEDWDRLQGELVDKVKEREVINGYS